VRCRPANCRCALADASDRHGAGTGIFHVSQGGLHANRVWRGVTPLFQRAIKTIAQGADNPATLAQQIQGFGE
jgi:hypothetical protein